MNSNSKIILSKINELKSIEDAIFDKDDIMSRVPLFRKDFFNDKLDKLLAKTESEVKALPLDASITEQLNSWIGRIDHKIDAITNRGTETARIRIPGWKKLKAKLNEIKFHFDSLESGGQKVEGATSKVAKVNDVNKSKLNQKETALLILYLRESGVFLKDATNKALAESFSKLTGFSSTRLTIDISGIINKSDLTADPNHYSNLASLINKMKVQIDKDLANLSS